MDNPQKFTNIYDNKQEVNDDLAKVDHATALIRPLQHLHHCVDPR